MQQSLQLEDIPILDDSQPWNTLTSDWESKQKAYLGGIQFH
jgi:hypothetical protein